MIKQKGAEGISEVYTYLSTHGEALGVLVAWAPIGGFVEGLVGSKVKQSFEVPILNALKCTMERAGLERGGHMPPRGGWKN